MKLNKITFLIFFIILSFFFIGNLGNSLFAEQKCNELPGFKKIGKDSEAYIKCMAKKSKELSKKGLKKLLFEPGIDVKKLNNKIDKQLKLHIPQIQLKNTFIFIL